MKLSDLRCSRLRVFVFGQSNILYRPKNQLLGADFSREELFRNSSDIVKLYKRFCALDFPTVRLGTNCENIFRKQTGNVFVFTICFDVGLSVLC
jgi:hypothetical protein